MDNEKISLRDVVSKRLNVGSPQRPPISEVQQQMRDINVVDNTIESARKLAGTDALTRQIEEEREKLERISAERDEYKDRLTATQIDSLKGTLEAQLNQMREQMNKGDRKGVLETLQEFQQASQLLGMNSAPSNGLDQIRTALELTQELTPKQRPLAEQIKEMLETSETLKAYAGGGAPAPVSTEIEQARLNIELQRMQQDSLLQIEQMKLEGQQRQREWELKMLEYEDSKKAREQEIQAKIGADKERTQILANSIELVGGAIAKATQEFRGGGGPPPPQHQSRPSPAAAATAAGIAGMAAGAAHSRGNGNHQESSSMGPTLQASVGEAGEVDCPNCTESLFLAGDASELRCTSCGTVFPVQRLEEGGPLE